MNWAYLKAEAFQTRYRLVASYTRGFNYIVEIGGYLTPITNFINPSEYVRVLSIDPLGENKQEGNVLHIRSKYQDIDIFQYVEPHKYILLILGLDLPVESGLIDLINQSAKFIVEYPIDIGWQQSHQEMLEILEKCNLELEFSIDIDCAGNDFGDLTGSYPPRTTRRFNVFRQATNEKKTTPPAYQEICARKNYQAYEISQLYLVNPLFSHNKIFPEADFYWSHDAIITNYSLGTGSLYYSIVSSLKAKICVCLGSGGGFVPRLVRQAQRDNWIKNSRTILIDADIGNYGRPNYMREDSFLRKHYPDIEIIKSTTKNAFEIIRSTVDKIDYLHIDADHSLGGSYEDFQLYSKLCDQYSIITFHDTRPYSYYKMDCWKALHLIRQEGHIVTDLPWLGAGVAIIQLSREQSQYTDPNSDVDVYIILGTNYSLAQIVVNYGQESLEFLSEELLNFVSNLSKIGLKINLVICKEFLFSLTQDYKLRWEYGLDENQQEKINVLVGDFTMQLAVIDAELEQKIEVSEMSLTEISRLFGQLTLQSNWIEIEMFMSISDKFSLLIPVVCRNKDIATKIGVN